MTELSDTFDSPLGLFDGYTSDNPTIDGYLAARKHINVRSFVSSDTLIPSSFLALASRTVGDLTGIQVGHIADGIVYKKGEQWTNSSIEPYAAIENRRVLRIDATSGSTVTATSIVQPPALPVFNAATQVLTLDLVSDFASTDTLSLSLPNFPATKLDLANSSLQLTSDQFGHSITLRFADAITVPSADGNCELAWPLSALTGANFVAQEVNGVRLVIKATATCTVRVAAMRVLAAGWKSSAFDIDTRTQRLEPSVHRNGSLTFDFAWPKLFRSPRPINEKVSIIFNTGSRTPVAESLADDIPDMDSIIVYLRERTENPITQTTLGGMTMADLNALPGQPDGGTLATATPGNAYNYVAVGWDSDHLHIRVADAATDYHSAYKVDTTAVQSNVDYLLQIDLNESSCQTRIWRWLGNERGALLCDTGIIEDDIVFKRRKGRIGWATKFFDGDANVSSVHVSDTVFAEYRSQPLESLTPVEGVELFVSGSADENLVTGLSSGPFGGLLGIDSARSNSKDGSIKIDNEAGVSFQGFQTNRFLVNDFDDIDVSFDVWLPRSISGESPVCFMLNDEGHYFTLPLPNIPSDQWFTVRVPTNKGHLSVPGYYRLCFVHPIQLRSAWNVDNVDIQQRSVAWSVRATDDPFDPVRDDAWTDARGVVNQAGNGVRVAKRGFFTQVRGQARTEDAVIQKVSFKPKYTELGRLAWPDLGADMPVGPTAVGTYTIDGQTVIFNGTGSFSPDGFIVDYSWTFGDGTTGSGPILSHTFSGDPSDYPVTLTVTDNHGLTGSVTLTLRAEVELLSGTWLPIDATGPRSMVIDSSGATLLNPNFGTNYPATDWNAEARPADYYDTFVDAHSKLVGRWRLDEASGTVAADTKGHDGTITGPVHFKRTDNLGRYWTSRGPMDLYQATTFPLTVTPVNVGSGSFVGYNVTVIVNAFDSSGNFLQASDIVVTPPTHNVDFQISWSAVSGAAVYKVYQSTGNTDTNPLVEEMYWLSHTVNAPTTSVVLTFVIFFDDYGIQYERPYSLGPNTFGKITVGDVLGMTGNTSFTVAFARGGTTTELSSLNGQMTDALGWDEGGKYPVGENDSNWIIKKLDSITYAESSTRPSVAAFSTAVSTSTSATTISVVIPASTQVGDLLILGWTWHDAASYSGVNKPSDWIGLENNTEEFSSAPLEQGAFYKFAEAGDPGRTVVLTTSTGAGAVHILRVIDAHRHHPIERVWANRYDGTAFGTDYVVIPTLPLQGPNRLVVGFMTESGIAGGNIGLTPTAGYTELADAQATVSSGAYHTGQEVIQQLPTGATTDVGHITLDNPSQSYDNLMPIMLIIKPRREPTTAVTGWGVKSERRGSLGVESVWIERWSGGDYDAYESNYVPYETLVFVTYDGSALTTPVAIDSAPSSRSIGTTSAPLVIGQNLSAAIEDIQVYSPALTPTEAGIIATLRDNRYSTSAAFYNVESLGQYEHFRATMKYNIGRSNVPNNFKYDSSGVTGLGSDVRLGMAVKIKVRDDSSLAYLNVAVSQNNIEAFFVADDGSYGTGIFATDQLDGYEHATPDMWTDDTDYWMQVEVVGESYTFRHYSSDPATSEPDYEGTLVNTSSDPEASTPAQFTGPGGVGITPWAGTPTTKILDYVVEPLPAPLPEVLPTLIGPAFTGRYDYPGDGYVPLPAQHYLETWSPDDFASQWSTYTDSGADAPALAHVSSGTLVADAVTDSLFRLSYFANEHKHVAEGQYASFKVLIPDFSYLWDSFYFGLGDHVAAFDFEDDVIKVTNLNTSNTVHSTILNSFLNMLENQWMWLVVKRPYGNNSLVFQLYDADPVGGGVTPVRTVTASLNTDNQALINAHNSPFFGWSQGDVAPEGYITVSDVTIGDIELLAPPATIGGDVDIPTDNPNGVTFFFDVTGTGVVSEIDVSLYVSVPAPYDAVMTLIAPDGTSYKLLNDLWGGSPDLGTGSADNQRLILSDTGTANVVDSTLDGPYVGTFRPCGHPLSHFRNKAAAGRWKLNFSNYQDGGTIHDLSLIFRTT